MIRSVRRILRSLPGNNLVDNEVLHTTLTEVEKILNDRPLIKITSDPNEYAALSPNHLLLLHQNPVTNDLPENVSTLNERWKRANSLADLIWNRWMKEYPHTLQSSAKWLKQGNNLTVGDLVLIGDVDAPKGQWQMGIVERAGPSLDGYVREVTSRTKHGTFRRNVYQLLEAHVETLQDGRIVQSMELTQGRGNVHFPRKPTVTIH